MAFSLLCLAAVERLCMFTIFCVDLFGAVLVGTLDLNPASAHVKFKSHLSYNMVRLGLNCRLCQPNLTLRGLYLTDGCLNLT